MKISLNWLKDFVSIPKDITPQQLAEDLTLHVAEVEDVIDQASMYDKMVIGEIKEIQNHANADKLKVCVTDIGARYPAQIVCGGDNIYEGMKVAVALPGAKIRPIPAKSDKSDNWASGQADMVELKKVKIRDVESQGMICSSSEIGLAESVAGQPEGERGVMDLKEIKAKPGTPLAEALGLSDVVIDIDNKSITNRPDLWSHMGMAREIAAIYGQKFEVHNQKSEFNPKSEKIDSNLEVKIEVKDLCPKYLALKMDNIKVSQSPDWLKQRLLAVGQKPINNLVDISNYVMFELGQPVHFFDAEKIANTRGQKQRHTRTIIVRQAKAGEKILTLDGQERKLNNDMLVIADDSKPLAIAGIMGGSNSEVDEKTKSIIIESASFDSISIRKISQQLGLRSEASIRFEKGLDPNLAEAAIGRVVELVQELISGAEVSSPLAEVSQWENRNSKIETNLEFIQKRLGVEITEKDVVDILSRLGFSPKILNSNLHFQIPSWRGNISIPEDIVEEVGRIYGYNRIPATLPMANSIGSEQTNVDLALERQITNYLTLAASLQEVENYVFEQVKINQVLGFNLDQNIEIANPLAADQEYLRRGLLPGLLKNVKANLRFYDTFGLFELGRVFRNQSNQDFKLAKDTNEFLPDQRRSLAGMLTDKQGSRSDLFFNVKGLVQGLFAQLRIPIVFKKKDFHFFRPGDSLVVQATESGLDLGELGLINQPTLDHLKVETQVAAFCLNYDLLVSLQKKTLVYSSVPEFPAAVRDLAIEVDNGVQYIDLEKVLKQSSQLLDKVELFDVYTGAQVGKNKRSLAWHLSFRHMDKTLTAAETDSEMAKITGNLEKKFKATVRA